MATRRNHSRQGQRANELRGKAGLYIRSLRQAAGLSQLEVSKALGYDYYSFISQVEQGVSRVPNDSYGEWAKVLKVDKREFVKKLLSFYDPETYAALYPRGKRNATSDGNNT